MGKDQRIGVFVYFVFGAGPVGVGVDVTFLSAQYFVNHWLDSYQIFMNI